MNIVITGPQGCGKGTQAVLISKEKNVKHVSMGDVLRNIVKNKEENHELIRDFMKKGELIPDEINNQAVKKVLDKNPEGVILDGYPRNITQANFLIKNSVIDLVLVLDISDEEAIKRIGKRRICTANNKIYIADQITEEDKKECEELGGEIITREDDQPVSVKKRLDIYHEKTTPVLDFFRKEGVNVQIIPAEAPIEEVFERIKKVL